MTIPLAPQITPRRRAALALVVLLLAFVAPAVAETPREVCLRNATSPPDYSALGREAYDRAAADWAAQCRQAIDSGDADPRLKVSLARALPHAQRAEEIALLRQAAAQDDGEAHFLLYDSHRSWDQHSDRPQMIIRAEADRALRRAAELGHPEAMFTLAILLERGGIVKRDPAAARIWAERALARPPETSGRGAVELVLARLLAGSDQPEERARGRAMLQRLSAAGVFGATSELAEAIRGDDPAQARALLERALRPDPGGAIPALAQMLANGEGGPADLRRAIRLVTSHPDIGAISKLRAELILDGRLPPRDVGKAIELMRHAGMWDYDARLRLQRLLIDNPGVRIERPDGVLYDAMTAMELDEPGATAMLISLKLSQHPQFRDPAGGCKLLATAAQRGGASSDARLQQCSGVETR